MKTFAVRFFGMSAEVERCIFVDTLRARHTDAILLSRSISFWKYSFFAFLTRFFTLFPNLLYSGKKNYIFSLSLFAIVFLVFLLSHGGNFGCFTRFRFKGACLLTTVR